MIAVLSALLALLTLLPRQFPAVDPLGLRRYLVADLPRTQLALYDATTDALVQGSRLLQVKGRTLKWSLVALLLAATAFPVGVLLA